MNSYSYNGRGFMQVTGDLRPGQAFKIENDSRTWLVSDDGKSVSSSDFTPPLPDSYKPGDSVIMDGKRYVVRYSTKHSTTVTPDPRNRHERRKAAAGARRKL